MNVKIFVLISANACVQAVADMTRPVEPFQNDYCSYVHSQHVLDRINSEVKPIF